MLGDSSKLQWAMKIYLIQSLCVKIWDFKKKTLPGFVQLKYGTIFEDKTIYFSFAKRNVQKQEPVIREQKREL